MVLVRLGTMVLVRLGTMVLVRLGTMVLVNFSYLEILKQLMGSQWGKARKAIGLGGRVQLYGVWGKEQHNTYL